MDTGVETIVIDFLDVQFENGKSNNIMQLIWTLENENTENEAICYLAMVMIWFQTIRLMWNPM